MFRRGRKGAIAAGVCAAFLLAQVCAAQPLGPPIDRATLAGDWAGLLSGLKAWLGEQAGPFTALWAEEGSSPDPDGRPNAAPEQPGSGSNADAGSSPDPDG